MAILNEIASQFVAERRVAAQTVEGHVPGLWRLDLYQRRWLVFGLCVVLTSSVCFVFNPRLFRHDLDVIDIVAGGIYLLLMFAGLFNLLLYTFGFFLLRAKLPVLLPRPESSGPSPCREGSWISDAREELPSSEGSGAGSVRSVFKAAIDTRTAIVMPIYHEDTERVYLGVRQTWLSLRRVGLDQHCDFYLLCDSTDPEIRELEEAVYQKLLADFDDNCNESGRLFLIRRQERKNFKAGNIAHFLERQGGAYDFMLVLDADSVMVRETIKRLILRMQASPNLAILQTVIIPIRAATPFARAMEFGIARCIPLFACGMYWFWGRDSIYWGHNALIRIEPFMTYCNLPIMPGNPPLGGPILSQDIVEAALLGRAGWAVEWDVWSGGSYDETPANILRYGRRDRRWCQGNFQHFWLIFGDHIRFAHRLYFATGIMAYLSGPLLVLLMALGFIQGLRGRIYQYESLMFWSFMVLFLTMLTLPRILGLVRSLKGQANRINGGFERVLQAIKESVSMFAELILSVLISPLLFYLHARFVLEILTGRIIVWGSQPRNPDERVAWSTAVRLFWLPTTLAAAWLPAAVLLAPSFLVYLAPMLTGWILSIPLAVWSSSPAVGSFLSRRGLLENYLAPDEAKELRLLLVSAI